MTRTKNSIYIPDQLMSLDYPGSSHIHLMHSLKLEEMRDLDKARLQKSLSLKKIINEMTLEEDNPMLTVKEMYYKNYNTPWTSEQDDELTVMYCEGINVRDIAKHLKRNTGGIISRIKKLELAAKYG